MSARGKELEDLVLKAARAYRRQGRCFLMKQQVRVVTTKDGFAQRAEKAPIDYLGWRKDGEFSVPTAIECKSHEGKSLPLRELDYGVIDNPDKAQWGALDAFDIGGESFALIHLTDVGELYLVPWVHIAGFAAAPWRKSLSLTFLRAFGQLVPIEDDGALFLDGAAHPDSEECLLDVWEERQARPVISLDAPDLESDPEPKPRPKRTPEEIRARVIAAANLGTERQLKEAGRQRKWRRRA